MTELEQTERALVGCVLEQPDLAASLKAEWFDDLRLGHLLLVMVGLLEKGCPIDHSTVLHASGGNEEAKLLILEAQAECHSAYNFPYWLEIIVQSAEKKRLKSAVDRFSLALPTANGDLAVHVAELENALSQTLTQNSSALSSQQCAAGLIDHLEQRMELRGALSGLDTGFADLNYKTSGFQFGEVTVLASRPSIGKTAIACNMVDKVCLMNGIPTLVLSLEMSATALCRRLLSSRMTVPMNTLKSGSYTNDDQRKFAIFNATLNKSPLFIQESFGSMGASEAAAMIRRHVKRHKVRFVVLDYLQKLKSDHKHEKRTYEVAEASGVLTAAVRETGVAFLCLAQLNRESERDKGRHPRLSDLADSGQIERDADNVLLLHRDRTDQQKPAQLIIAKQRDGEVGMIPLHFDGRYCRFSDSTNREAS